MEKVLPNENNENELSIHYDEINKTIELVHDEVEEVGSMRYRFYEGRDDNPGYDQINKDFIEDLYKILEENKSDTNRNEILGLLNNHTQLIEDTKKDRGNLRISGEKIKNFKKIDKDTPLHEIDGIADTIQIESNTVLEEVESEKDEFKKHHKSVEFISQELLLIMEATEKRGVLDISETLAGKISRKLYQHIKEMAVQENRLASLTSTQEELHSVMRSRAAKIRNSVSMISHLLSQEPEA